MSARALRRVRRVRSRSRNQRSGCRRSGRTLPTTASPAREKQRQAGGTNSSASISSQAGAPRPAGHGKAVKAKPGGMIAGGRKPGGGADEDASPPTRARTRGRSRGESGEDGRGQHGAIEDESRRTHLERVDVVRGRLEQAESGSGGGAQAESASPLPSSASTVGSASGGPRGCGENHVGEPLPRRNSQLRLAGKGPKGTPPDAASTETAPADPGAGPAGPMPNEMLVTTSPGDNPSRGRRDADHRRRQRARRRWNGGVEDVGRRRQDDRRAHGTAGSG